MDAPRTKKVRPAGETTAAVSVGIEVTGESWFAQREQLAEGLVRAAREIAASPTRIERGNDAGGVRYRIYFFDADPSTDGSGSAPSSTAGIQPVEKGAK